MSFVDAIKSAADALRSLTDAELLDLAARAAQTSTVVPSPTEALREELAPTRTDGLSSLQGRVFDALANGSLTAQEIGHAIGQTWGPGDALNALARKGLVGSQIISNQRVWSRTSPSSSPMEVAKSTAKKEPRKSEPSPPSKGQPKSDRKTRILQYVLQSHLELTTGEVAKALRLNPLLVSPMLRALVKSGHVAWNGRQTNRSRVAATKELLT